MQPISRTAALLESNGRRKKIEISVKRRFIRDWNDPFNWIEIQRFPTDAQIYTDYKFEIIQHDLHLAFAPGLKDLPFLRIGDPLSDGIWVLWFIGWDDFTPNNPITPQLLDRGEGYVEWRLDETTRFRIEILGHLIRKLIIVERRPVWNRLRFRLGRANALLVDGAGVGIPQKRLLAFRKGASWQDNPIFWFTEPKAWDSQADIPATVKPDYILTPITDALWDMEIALDPEWLDNAQYPVYIDPTIVLQPGPDEGIDNFLWVDATGNHGSMNLLGLQYDTRADFSPPHNLGQILFKFDLSAIPPGSNIDNATLEIYKYSGGYSGDSGSDVPFYPWRLLKDWKEMTSNPTYYDTDLPWDEYKANSIGGDVDNYVDPPHSMMSIIGSAMYSAHQIVLTGTIQNIINAGFNYGFKLATENVDTYPFNYIYFWIYSSDSNPSYYPKLTVDYAENSGSKSVFIPAKIGAIAGKKILEQITK